ncbi:MerC domain-containing protein [Brevundimonas sp.]|uniref:MerC domain-containing protein n=1 Tax=Brevundimonas sp. TaxID=1871086 RepID=UPI001DBF900A|nr:MerC domain-containing protein [Brevundimonas sp.]MBA3999449.1 hypothetical protein [Brevundimonas sp.]
MPAARTAALGDSLAIGVSGLCLTHCLALPLVASLLPLAGVWAETEWVHWLFVAIAAPVSLWAFSRPVTRSWSLAILAGSGLALLVAGVAAFPSHDWETGLTVAGALLLAGAHTLNWRHRKLDRHVAH